MLAPGSRADIAIWDMTGITATGAWGMVAALILCPPVGARDVFVDCRVVVRDGELVRVARRDVLRAADASLARLMALA